MNDVTPQMGGPRHSIYLLHDSFEPPLRPHHGDGADDLGVQHAQCPVLPREEDGRLVQRHPQWHHHHQLKEQAQQQRHHANQDEGHKQGLDGLPDTKIHHLFTARLLPASLPVNTKFTTCLHPTCLPHHHLRTQNSPLVYSPLAYCINTCKRKIHHLFTTCLLTASLPVNTTFPTCLQPACFLHDSLSTQNPTTCPQHTCSLRHGLGCLFRLLCKLYSVILLYRQVTNKSIFFSFSIRSTVMMKLT